VIGGVVNAVSPAPAPGAVTTTVTKASARTRAAHGIATDALAAHSDSTLAKKSRKKNELFSKVPQGNWERHLLLDDLYHTCNVHTMVTIYDYIKWKSCGSGEVKKKLKILCVRE